MKQVVSRMPIKLVLGVVVTLILATLLFRFFFVVPSQQSMQFVSLVETIEVKEDTFFDEIKALGTTKAYESVDITAQSTEVITRIRFKDGQLVDEGDVLVTLEQQEERAQLMAAELQQAEHMRELERQEVLLKSKAAAKRDYDERLTLLKIAEQQVEEAKAKVKDRTIHAPFDGVVGLRRLSEGALVQPGTLITTLDNIDRIKLDFSIPSVHLATLEKGMKIKATSEAFGENAFDGRIRAINPRVDPVTRSVMVRAILPNDSNMLKPGLLMHVNIQKERRVVVVIPEECVFQKERKHFVYAVNMEDKTAHIREVEIGKRFPGKVEITSGLEPGEHIVFRGIHKVQPGQKVQITNERKSDTATMQEG